MILFPIPYVAQYDGNIYYKETRLYCANQMAEVDPKVFYAVSAMLILDLLITSGDFALLLWNKYQTAKNKRRVSDFNLIRSFNLREVEISIEIIFPFSVGHSAGYVFCLFYYLVYISNMDSLSLEQDMFYNETIIFWRVLTMFLLIFGFWQYLLHKENKQQANFVARNLTAQLETDVYFQQFQRAIA
ncbi:hypothetical protein M3Y97_00166700 [Aphelenchoides bicaudatus]|nr:hypothetical protein M3Y97_00166700 [Aphelenchoides bicaudatus]